MAKVVKGARRGKDPVMRYGSYKNPTTGKIIRRATHPEYYMHSWSRQVRENRKLFAQVMENYSKMDIVTKQAYTEAIWLRPPTPIPPQVRKKLNDIWSRARRRIHISPYWIPPYVPVPWDIPVPLPIPNPYISPWPWPYPDYQPWPRQSSVGGHQEAIRQGMGYGQQRDPTRNPLPGEIPLPGPEPKEDRNPPRNPIIITVEIDPGGLLGKSWDLYLWVKSEYTMVERWITSHKKEVIIIIAFGTLVFFTYSLVIGGVTFEAGSELLVTPAAEKFYPLGAILIPHIDIKRIKDRYYKLIKVDLMEKLNAWAINLDTGKTCYRTKEEDEWGFTYYFYTGPDEEHKGELAGDISVFIDWDKGEANIIPHCYNPPEPVAIYSGAQLLITCGPTRRFKDFITVIDVDTHRNADLLSLEEGDNYKRWVWEGYGYHEPGHPDLTITITYDDNKMPQQMTIQETRHFETFSIYYSGYHVITLPGRGGYPNDWTNTTTIRFIY